MATNNIDIDSLRLSKVARDIVKTLQRLLDKTETEQEFVDVIGLWLQSIGAEMATTVNATEDGIDDFLPFCVDSLKVAYQARWEYLNGKS